MDNLERQIVKMDAKLDAILEKTSTLDSRVTALDVKVDMLNNFKIKITGAAMLLGFFILAMWDIFKIKLEKLH